MQIFRSSQEAESSILPPATKAAVLEAVRSLEEVFGKDFNSNEHGYVVLIEQDDTAETVKDHFGRLLFQMPIEGVFIRHGCLLAVTLWGNSGEGITWVCPDRDGCASDVRCKLKDELPAAKGGRRGEDQQKETH